MAHLARHLAIAALLTAATLAAGCRSSHLEPPQVQGPVTMVNDDGKSMLWAMVKQEEVRQVGVGGGSSRNSPGWRSDTFYHFELRAFDPATMRPAWTSRLLTLGDDDAKGTGPSRVIGSGVGARVLGQDGDLVWLLIGDAPYAVSASDGEIVADAEELQRRLPELQGLLPSEAKHYGFDYGLVLMTADARQFVLRARPDLKALPYTPPPPATAPLGPLQANGQHKTVPMEPLGSEIPRRHTMLGDQWLGLYSDAEAADARDDQWGDKLAYPYTIEDEGRLARRTFWRAKTDTVQHFDDRYERFTDLVPVAGSPMFLKGRFLSDLGADQAMRIGAPPGVLVWHSTRIDDAGRLALSRVDGDLKTTWTAELPLSETDFINPLHYWQLRGRVVVSGELQTQADGVTTRDPMLVSIELETGEVQAWNLAREAAVP